MPQTVIVENMTVEISELDERNVSVPVKAPSKKVANSNSARGRTRLHTVCPLHGTSSDGAHPCAKFAHLPGKGKGAKQPNPFVLVLVIGRALTKPVIILGLTAVTVWLFLHEMDGIIPGLTPTSVQEVSKEHAKLTPGASTTTAKDHLSGAECLTALNPCNLVLPQ